jgi:threonine dehydrogenase-like Zn-dependent dehydrogenase
LFRHENVGEATEVGSEVKAFKVGEIVGVGCIHAKPVIHAHDISNSIARRR